MSMTDQPPSWLIIGVIVMAIFDGDGLDDLSS